MPRTLSVEEYKELGKRYYGRKDYQKALDAFTEGIDASAGRDIQLYDYRAATYDKMENMTLALTDARWMIKAYEKDPRGYLRAGQLLLKLEKTQQALQIYARGLRYVPATNAQISLLRGAHDKLNRELCPPKAVDPLTQLPQEIVEMVMAYLKFYELVSCLRVSKQWKQFLESLPNLWTKMDLLRAGVKRAVKPSFVQTCMRMSRNKITYARIANFGHRGILQHLVKTCTSLEKLEFVLTQFGADSILEATIPCRQLKSLILHADIELQGDTIRQILKHRPTLEELRVHSVGPICSTNQGYNFDLPNLHILDLRAVHPRFIYANHLTDIVHQAPNLHEVRFEEQPGGWQHLSIEQIFTSLHHLQTLKIKSTSFHGFPGAALTIKDLDVNCSGPIFMDENVPNVPNGFPCLERLSIKNMQIDPLHVLDPLHGNEGKDVEILSRPSMMKSLTLGFTSHQSANITDVLTHARLREVEELALECLAAEGISDTMIASTMTMVQLKHLRRLHLDSAPITGVGIKQLVTELKGTLQSLTLTACDAVGRDAVDWAARQGVAVTINEGGSNGGPKVVRRR